MPPKRKVKEEYDDDFIDGDEDVVKNSQKKRTPQKKKKAVEDVDGDAKPKKAKSKPVTETFTAADGYTIRPPSLIYKADPAAQGGTKIAAIDLDGTLVVTKSGARFPVDSSDWQWFNKGVPLKLKQLQEEEGYQLVIISNQGGVRGALDGQASRNVRGRVDGLLADARKKTGSKLPVQVFMATQNDDLRKPNTGMWDFLVGSCNGGVKPDLAECFYCGDMAGREGDIEVTDRQFASNVGIAFKTPEELFGERDEGEVGPNAGLAAAFKQLAEQSRAAGDNMFKVSAYEKVSKLLAAYPTPITSAKQVAKEKGVGKGSLAKIEEYLSTGTIASLEVGAKTAEAAAAPPPTDSVALKFL